MFLIKYNRIYVLYFIFMRMFVHTSWRSSKQFYVVSLALATHKVKLNVMEHVTQRQFPELSFCYHAILLQVIVIYVKIRFGKWYLLEKDSCGKIG